MLTLFLNPVSIPCAYLILDTYLSSIPSLPPNSAITHIMPTLFVPPMLCQQPVPPTAAEASPQIQTSVRTALAAGRRRLIVDLLISSIDPRSRVFDDSSASSIFACLVQSLQPILPNPRLTVLVPGSTAALRTNKWLQSESLDHVTVDILGSPDPLRHSNALIIVNPPGKGDAILDFRNALKEAHHQNIPVIVHNHPRDDAVYEILGFGGGIPYELTDYEPVFVLAPFAINAEQDTAPPERFVLMRQYPGKWALWRHQGQPGMFEAAQEDQDYSLCEQYVSRPSDNLLMTAIAEDLKSP